MLRVVLMGVAGCGKTSVGEALSVRLGVPYRDGDDLHPKANVEKMRLGTPLTDEDRWPWLALVGETLAKDAPLIIGCSALKRAYRNKIRVAANGRVDFIHLSGNRALIEQRMAQRKGHFMPVALLDSQFATLEPPTADEAALTVDIGQPLISIVDRIANHLAKVPE